MKQHGDNNIVFREYMSLDTRDTFMLGVSMFGVIWTLLFPGSTTPAALLAALATASAWIFNTDRRRPLAGRNQRIGFAFTALTTCFMCILTWTGKFLPVRKNFPRFDIVFFAPDGVFPGLRIWYIGFAIFIGVIYFLLLYGSILSEKGTKVVESEFYELTFDHLVKQELAAGNRS